MFFSSVTIEPRKCFRSHDVNVHETKGTRPGLRKEEAVPTRWTSAAASAKPGRRFEALVRKSYKGRFGPLLRRRAGHIHHHRKQRVVPVDSNQVNDALFAKLCQYFGIGWVAHRLVMVQFGAEVVDRRFFFRQPRGASSLGEGLDCFGGHPSFESDRAMHAPFKLLGPLTRRDQNGKLTESGGQHALVAKVVSHGLRAQHYLRAAKKRNEGTRGSSSSPCDKFVHRLLLRLRQFVRRNLRHSILSH